MGLFDVFKREKPALPLAEIFHDMAHFLLPMKTFEDVDYVIRTCFGPEGDAVGIFYLTACAARRIKNPDPRVPGAFHWHVRKLSSQVDCYVVEFPRPAPVDLNTGSGATDDSRTLAPYFAGIIHDRSGNELRYYVLGQAPVGGDTTLWKITPDGVTCDLGAGPRPELDAFIQAIKHERRRVKASIRMW